MWFFCLLIRVYSQWTSTLAFAMKMGTIDFNGAIQIQWCQTSKDKMQMLKLTLTVSGPLKPIHTEHLRLYMWLHLRLRLKRVPLICLDLFTLTSCKHRRCSVLTGPKWSTKPRLPTNNKFCCLYKQMLNLMSLALTATCTYVSQCALDVQG